MSNKYFPSCYLSSLDPIFHVTCFLLFNICQKTTFLNLKGGKKPEISAFFETQKLDFLRNKLSVEKNFLSQEAGMIRLSFDKKNF